jgi:hypothetical protein
MRHDQRAGRATTTDVRSGATGKPPRPLAGNGPVSSRLSDMRASGDPAPPDWGLVLDAAWRPAWSIRSRRGALVPLIAWWRGRRKLDQPTTR